MGGTIVDEPCPTVARLAVNSMIFVTYHHHLCPDLQTPITITSAVRSMRICDMPISLASHLGRIIGGRVARLMDLYVWGSLNSVNALRAYYHI
eukprot:1662870-Pleurochrysis_carterae.AAC.1